MTVGKENLFRGQILEVNGSGNSFLRDVFKIRLWELTLHTMEINTSHYGN